MVEKLIDSVLYWCLSRNYQARRPRPSKDEIADLIDRRLESAKGGEDGKFISHQRNGYRYYITRSYDERYGKR